MTSVIPVNIFMLLLCCVKKFVTKTPELLDSLEELVFLIYCSFEIQNYCNY